MSRGVGRSPEKGLEGWHKNMKNRGEGLCYRGLKSGSLGGGGTELEQKGGGKKKKMVEKKKLTHVARSVWGQQKGFGKTLTGRDRTISQQCG